MPVTPPEYELRIASSEADLHLVQRLRYAVFVEELGGGGEMVDHAAGLERDAFDAHATQLMLVDRHSGTLAGVYRLMDRKAADAAGGFYSAAEYDLAPLLASGRPLLELGRSCLHPAYRGTDALYHLWNGLSRHVTETGAEILFGVASFHGTDITALRQPLSYLYRNHRAPADLRVRATGDTAVSMDLLPPEQIDRREALLAIPALIKGYLRLGGTVGDGAWIDHVFNTTDVCLVMDTARLNERTARIYARESAG